MRRRALSGARRDVARFTALSVTTSGHWGEAEGAFLLCGFMMALAEHQQGRTAHALRLFERNRAACGPPGLFSEEYDIIQWQMRGNLPQAFVHVLLLECVGRLAEASPALA